MKFYVQLGRLVRETKHLVVEANSEDDLHNRLSEVYREDPDDDGWEPDYDWGCEESDSHAAIGPAKEEDKVDFVLETQL